MKIRNNRFFTALAMLVSIEIALVTAFAQSIPQAQPSTAMPAKSASTATESPAISTKSGGGIAPSATSGNTPATGSNSTSDYVIGNEDTLAINVWREPEMSRTVPVRPDGKISLPLLGEFTAEGSTPRQLEQMLVKKLETLVTNPEVTVIVVEIRSQKFNIIGEVNRPGTYPLTKPMTLIDAIALAGGLKDFANTKKMYILRRDGAGKTTRVPVNYKAILKGGTDNKKLELESRDTIVVP